MKKRLSTIILVIVMVAGLSLLLYPTVSDYWNSMFASRMVVNYAEATAKMDDATYNAILNGARAYNKALFEKRNPYDLTDEDHAAYNEALNPSGNGMIGYVEISVIHLQLPVYHTVDESVLQQGVGHIEGTSLPVGGPSTHAVLSGHRGLPSAKLFTDLDRVTVGDTFLLRILDEELTYEVDQIRVVSPEELDELKIVEGKDYCTLVTCTPYGINSHRLLVRGHRIKTDDTGSRVTADAVKIDSILTAPIFAAPLLLFLLAYLLIRYRKRK